MHDLDADRRERALARQAALGERTFIFGGEQFVHKADCPYYVVRRAAEIQEQTGIDVFYSMESCVLEMMEPGPALPQTAEELAEGDPVRYEDHERFKEILRRKEDPINADDLGQLLRWLMGATTGRPTVPSSDSTPGSPESGTNSTATSSPTPAAASTS